jgi:hypothetical protein
MSFFIRFKRLYSLPEKNLDSICSPHGDTGTEKIGILGPHWACQSERCGEYRPIGFVTAAQPLPGFDLKVGVNLRRDRLNDISQVFERCGNVSVWDSPFLQEEGQIFLGVIEGDVWCIEADALACERVNELPNSAPQNGTDENVRIENDHFIEILSSRAGATP